ncbi:unnamed protein product [Chondrus crispus]|uniref:P21-activated protein kinase-interacting protein 1-like n=1 Tax=Chondrus crispus TaxID=2769 RepID=R7QHB0_CHOCR|nr:unnamed protein product [Chondrus crispus]CDF37138.1 unnamed protein product [Chondrus crispus]|eukprot:XP_005716957.1 unnamed protein product [Chondrus crispus]
MVANPSEEKPAAGTNICVGGYDGSVAGLTLRPDAEDLLSLQATFAYASHITAVRSAALSGSTLVTGSADETVRIYDLARRVERGSLFEHSGTVNALVFFRDGPRRLLMSAGDDALMCVWRTSDWKCLKRMHGHQAPVLDVAVHPSARVALSVAKDRSLFMWNMVKGKIAFSAKTKETPATTVEWAPGGERYMLVAGKSVKLSNVEGKDVETFVHERPVLAAAFVKEGVLATGGEDKIVRVWDQRTGGCVIACKHEKRVRGVACVDGLVVAADSGGGVKIWDARMGGSARLETCLGGGDMRLTCLAAAKEVEEVEKVPKTEEEEEGETKDEGRQEKGKGARRKRREERPAPLEGTASQRKRKKRKEQKAS